MSAEIRLIDGEGEMLGVLNIFDALQAGWDAGLDVVEVSPNAEPPVCKLLDFGKFKYEQQKKANEARKKQKVIEVKEIKLRPGIDDHDYDVKMRAMVPLPGGRRQGQGDACASAAAKWCTRNSATSCSSA